MIDIFFLVFCIFFSITSIITFFFTKGGYYILFKPKCSLEKQQKSKLEKLLKL